MTLQEHTTIRQARIEAVSTLRAGGIDSAALDARVLLAHVLGESQTGLLLRDPDPISVEDLRRYRDVIAQRSTGVPVAYLTGSREFMGLDFFTSPDVLVPRPDTEPLVEWGLKWLGRHPDATVVDIGTGSGAIAISVVAHAGPEWRGKLFATDVSEDALVVARQNAKALLTLEQQSRLEFVVGSMTEPLNSPIDLLLTNLPYLTPGQIASNPDLRHEPGVALDGGADGLDLVRKVIADLPRLLSADSAVGFEIDPSQAAEVRRLLSQTLPHHIVTVVRDIAGSERHVVAQASSESFR